MAVKIRLKRFGKRSYATYRIVAIDESAKRQGREVESLGIYDPNTNPPKFKIDTSRLKYWNSVGAEKSDTIKNLIKKISLK